MAEDDYGYSENVLFYSRSRKRQVENSQDQKDVIQVNVSARRERKLKQVGDDRCEINSPLRDQYPWWSGLIVHLVTRLSPSSCFGIP